MSDQELSELFNRHAFDPWHPHNRERNCLYVLDYAAFQKAVREAIAAETTRELVDAMRPFARLIHCLPNNYEPTMIGNFKDTEIREAARLVAEFDARQRPAFGDGQAAFDAAQQQKGPTP